MILGVNPGTSADMVALPPGNRYGQFSVEPGGNGIESSRRAAGSSPNGGTSEGAGGGNESTGVGSGKTGGGRWRFREIPESSVFVVTAEPAKVWGAWSQSTWRAWFLRCRKFPGRVTACANGRGPAGPMGGGGLTTSMARYAAGKFIQYFYRRPARCFLTLLFCRTRCSRCRAGCQSLRKRRSHGASLGAAGKQETRFDFKRTPAAI